MKNALLIGVSALAIYWYLKCQKKELKKEDIKSPAKAPEVQLPFSGYKKPIYLNAINVIPNVYDRGVGRPVMLYANGSTNPQTNETLGGFCTESMTAACKCNEKRATRYPLDIPQLP